MRSTFYGQFVLAGLIGMIAAGCHDPVAATPGMFEAVDGLAAPAAVDSVEAICAPPAGWRAEPLKSSERHRHQVWISPSGNTAYGVILMELPNLAVLVGPQVVLERGFLANMKRTEGRADLIGPIIQDDKLDGIRFIAEGGLYLVRGTLMKRGTRAWCVYAGTLLAHRENDEELRAAELARENTAINVSSDAATTAPAAATTQSEIVCPPVYLSTTR